MSAPTSFQIEIIDGHRLGKLSLPLGETADWINFLADPQYQAEIISAEQGIDRLELYFEASEGLYLYLDMRLHPSVFWQPWELAIAL